MMSDMPLMAVVGWIVYAIIPVVAAILMLVILWRWMRAHEKIAQSLAGIDERLADRWRSQEL